MASNIIELKAELTDKIGKAVEKLIEGNKDTEEAEQIWADGIKDLYALVDFVYYTILENANDHIHKAVDNAREEIHQAMQKLLEGKYDYKSDQWGKGVDEMYNVPLHIRTYLTNAIAGGKNNG